MKIPPLLLTKQTAFDETKKESKHGVREGNELSGLHNCCCSGNEWKSSQQTELVDEAKGLVSGKKKIDKMKMKMET